MAGSPCPVAGHAAGDRQDVHAGDHHLLRPDRGLARHHPDPDRATTSSRSTETVGRAMPGIEVKVVDPKTGERRARRRPGGGRAAAATT
ncbi:MAG: hypothetical protein MZV70_41030 [Desulfobacterales bacterium]|nr:hypothetical protein [Desulfobacterales bacterium]